MANIYKNQKKDLTTNTVTTLYSVPSNSRAIVKSILVCDDTNNGSDITVDLFDGDPASANKFTIFQNKTIAGNATEQLLSEPLIMQESEILKVQASSGAVDVIASVLEINREDK